MTDRSDEPRDDDAAPGSEENATETGGGSPPDVAPVDDAERESADAAEAADTGSSGDAPHDAGDGAGEAVKAAPARESAPTAKPSRTHRIRGGILFALGLAGMFVLMALEAAPGRGALYGIPLALLATAGLLDMLGLLAASLVPPKELEATTSWRSTWVAAIGNEPFFLAPFVTIPVAIAIAVLAAVFAPWEELPAYLILALAVLGPAAARRPGLLVFVISSGIILPFLGVYGLWDPWETHYGEVAREILARDDWISLWWAHEEWFFSKPILIFWTEALSMSAFGFDPLPHANNPHPEWAVRFPEYVLSTVALLCIYAMVSRTHGKRAGALASLVVVTLPHFFLLSHQAITDMPFVSTMTMAICMLGIAISSDEGAEAPRYRFGPIVVSGQTLALGTIATVALPQAMYLFTRNVTLVEGGFAWHGDRFMFGSAGNAGNPGHPAAREVTPVFDGLFSQPGMQALYWVIGLGLVAWMLRRERRVRHLAMFGFYFFCALAFMAKGLMGIALPGMVALFYLIGSRRWQLLLGGELRVAAGILVIAIVGLPWYVAMYMRHGTAFTDRLLVHDHINRLTTGVHGDTGSIEYFLEQLGFGLFPWIALAPLALGAWIAWRRPTADRQAAAAGPYREGEARADDVADPSEKRRHVAMIVGLWGTTAFVFFSAMTTKFHHYIFPVVPAAGILFALAAEPLFGSQEDLPPLRRGLATVLAVVAPVLIVLGVAGWWGDVRGVIPEGVESAAIDTWVFDHRWTTSDCIALVTAGMAGLVGAWWLLRSKLDEGVLRPAATMALFSAPAIVGLVGRDLSWVTESRPYGYERLIHLFVYNYQRPWPEQFDYRPILTAFAIVATVLIGLAAITAVRAVAMRAFLGTALAFAVWTLDVYIVDLAPHWGQREIVQAIYAVREGDEAIIAWQMNWKGENFYTGNGCYIFVDLDNRPLETWAEAHPGERFFVLTEHSRVGSLRTLLRGAVVTPLTTPRIDNKFLSVEVRMPGYPGVPASAAAPSTAPVRATAAALAAPTAAAVAAPSAPPPVVAPGE